MTRFDTRLAALALLCAAAASAIADDRDDLTQRVHAFLAGVDRAEVHDAFWADDLIYTSSRGTRTTKADIMRGFDGAQPDAEGPATVYTAEDIQVQVYGDTAVVAFRLVATPPGDDAEVSSYLNTGTFVKRDGTWQVVAWQATTIPD
jgi:ketosteroid isomerase-like protein